MTNDERIFIIALGILVAVYFSICFAAWKRYTEERAAEQAAEQPVPQWSATELLRRQTDTLSDWEALQLAIIITESGCNPSALGENQDAGLYQMTPVYVAEINRVAGTDYAHADAFDPDKAVEMFGALQDHYNPEHDPDTAIYYHNKGAGYRRAVLNNLDFVRRYESARKAIRK